MPAQVVAFLYLPVYIVHRSPIVSRSYNLGLVTDSLMFLPLGCYGLEAVQKCGGGTLAMHVTGLFVAIAIHAGTLTHARRSLAVVKSTPAAAPHVR